jgi:hypothetical protein
MHLVQATLGHSSTTSAYLHARPGDSSARFLTLENYSQESGRFQLRSFRTGVMDVSTATNPRQKEKYGNVHNRLR